MNCSICQQPMNANGECPQHPGPPVVDPPDSLLGRQLGEYVVRRKIGAGGMGVVYEGWQPLIERRVAIKVLKGDLGDGGAVNGLLAEARAANAIRHRGIIDIFGFGSLEHVGPYIIMEFLEGLALDEVVHRRAPMTCGEVVKILDEILAALGAAHSHGVIHRDLKPSNVFMVAESGGGSYVKVLDFGLAKRASTPNGATPQTRASVVVGTPEYMAPEQAMGQPVSPRTDLYALGIIAFEMLTGRIPFTADSAFGIAMHQVNTPAPNVRDFEQSVPESMATLLAQLLEKDPLKRPETAETVRGRLRAIGKELVQAETRMGPVGPSQQAPTDKVGPPIKAGPSTKALGLGAAALVVLLAAGGWLVTRPGEAPPPAEPPVAVAVVPAEPAKPAQPPKPAEPPAEEPPLAPLEPVAAKVEEKQPEPAARPVEAKAVKVARAEKASAKKPAAGEGTLNIFVIGSWADVKVDGEAKGRAANDLSITLPAGKHVLELSNPHRKSYSKTIVVPAGETLSHEAELADL